DRVANVARMADNNSIRQWTVHQNIRKTVCKPADAIDGYATIAQRAQQSSKRVASIFATRGIHFRPEDSLIASLAKSLATGIRAELPSLGGCLSALATGVWGRDTMTRDR